MTLKRRSKSNPSGRTFLRVMLAAALMAGSVELVAQEESNGFDVFSGRVTFQRYCASCHGPEARGDGNIAQYLKVEPADLTQLARRHDGDFPADTIRSFIDGREPVKGHGLREMPVWGEVFQSTLTAPAASADQGEDRARKIIDQLVMYLASIQVE